jgi:hypothetical protein
MLRDIILLARRPLAVMQAGEFALIESRGYFGQRYPEVFNREAVARAWNQ